MDVDNHVTLWKMLIERNLPPYFNIKETHHSVIVIHAILEAISHMEPSVFNNLSKREQGWIMSVVPSLSNHPDEQIESKSIHAVGDMILIKGRNNMNPITS